ncbi:MAG: GIY-YIG nuclease family protein [Candidatus Heimdallarchaeota archaeon]
MKYFVYMVTCADGTLYTGYTSNISQRINQHNSAKSGAKYTRKRRPVKLSYYEILSSQRDAMRREREIKKLTRNQKLNLICSSSFAAE